MKILIFLGNTCNYSFIYQKYTMMFTEYQSYSIVDYHGIKRDFPSWFEEDFYKVPRVVIINANSKVSYVYNFLKLISKFGRRNISFHCFGLQSCILPLLLGIDFIYHGYGDILSTPFMDNYKIKTFLRVILSKISLKYCKTLVVSQSTDIPYLEYFNVDKTKIKFIPLISDDSKAVSCNLNREIASLFDANKIIFVPTRNIEIKQLGIFLDSLNNVFNRNVQLFEDNNIKIVFIKWGDLWEEHMFKFEHKEIKRYIYWIDLQSRDALMELMSKSYLIINEFTDPLKYPGFIGGITREAMSLGKPVISHYSFEHDHLFHKTKPPLIQFDNNVSSVERILENILRLSNDEMLEFGSKLKEWYDSEYQIAELISKTSSLHYV